MAKIFKKIKNKIKNHFKQKIIEALKKEEDAKNLFPTSKLANHYLLGKRGIEIGGAIHNQFKLNTLNINFTDDKTIFSESEMDLSKDSLKVDIVASGDALPFKDNFWDFVINSHVLEHFFDPITAIEEWIRVIKPGGYLFMIIPHKERTFDNIRERTSLQELIDRNLGIIPNPKEDGHHSVWITEDLLELCKYMKLNVIDYQDIDDKVGNGFTIVIKKD